MRSYPSDASSVSANTVFFGEWGIDHAARPPDMQMEVPWDADFVRWGDRYRLHDKTGAALRAAIDAAIEDMARALPCKGNAGAAQPRVAYEALTNTQKRIPEDFAQMPLITPELCIVFYGAVKEDKGFANGWRVDFAIWAGLNDGRFRSPIVLEIDGRSHYGALKLRDDPNLKGDDLRDERFRRHTVRDRILRHLYPRCYRFTASEIDDAKSVSMACLEVLFNMPFAGVHPLAFTKCGSAEPHPRAANSSRERREHLTSAVEILEVPALD